MFARGVHPEDKVSSWCYDESEEDFTKDAKELDTWVLNHLRDTLRNATQNPGSTLDRHLRQSGVVFFLHLLGLDTTGHSYRPFSKEYMDNIIHVDRIVEEVERMLTEFYEHDDAPEDTSGTAYVFTADHGMSVIGNHGDGDPDNTRTPLIAWGAGIRGPISDTNFGSTFNSTHDSYSSPAWGTALTKLARADVQQADVAALMSALLGSNWPMNSVGVVPGFVDGPGYLKEGDARGSEQMARIAAILEQYRVKHSIKASRHLRYKPFPPLAPGAGGALPPGALELRELERLLAARDWQTTRIQAKQYDRYVLRFIVTAGYIGWMIFSALHVLHTHVVPSADPDEKPTNAEGLSALDVLSIATLTVTAGIFAYQRSPWSYYLYVAFPIYFFRSILKEGNALYEVLEKRMDWGTFPTPEAVLGWGVGIIAVLECMVLAYTHRELWTLLFVILGVVWPLVAWPKNFYQQNLALSLAWTMGCLTSGVFTVLSVEKTESIALISLGAAAILLLGFAASQTTISEDSAATSSNHSYLGRLTKLTRIQMITIVAALLTTASSARSLQNKQGLPAVNQLAGWSILVASIIIPILVPSPTPSPTYKLQQYFLTFGPLFVLLSISTEGLFYASFSQTLYIWVEVEARLYQLVEGPTRRRTAAKTVAKRDRGWRAEALSRNWGEDSEPKQAKREIHAAGQPRGLIGADVRRAVFFLFFVQVAFFGAANVTIPQSVSLPSQPVYRLIPVFNPFFMASLLIFKIVAPYVILSTVFATLNARVALPPFALFKVALGLTDVMSLTFFYLVQDTGSWLEIGQSISFYVITSLLLVWSAGICAAGDPVNAFFPRDKPIPTPQYVKAVAIPHLERLASHDDLSFEVIDSLKNVLALANFPKELRCLNNNALLTGCVEGLRDCMYILREYDMPELLSYELGFFCFRVVLLIVQVGILTRANMLDSFVNNHSDSFDPSNISFDLSSAATQLVLDAAKEDNSREILFGTFKSRTGENLPLWANGYVGGADVEFLTKMIWRSRQDFLTICDQVSTTGWSFALLVLGEHLRWALKGGERSWTLEWAGLQILCYRQILVAPSPIEISYLTDISIVAQGQRTEISNEMFSKAILGQDDARLLMKLIARRMKPSPGVTQLPPRSAEPLLGWFSSYYINLDAKNLSTGLLEATYLWTWSELTSDTAQRPSSNNNLI
ncbi:Glycosyl phosphatidyl inositol anchor synthesis, partial [Ceratobasidium sp. 392]